MKIKEEAIKELEELDAAEMLKVYDLIQSLKRKPPAEREKENLLAYLRVKEALKQCKGSLSNDILSAREERV